MAFLPGKIETLSSLSLELVCIVTTSPLIFFYIFVKLCAVASKVDTFSSFIALGYLVGDYANIYITEPIVLIYIYIVYVQLAEMFRKCYLYLKYSNANPQYKN